MPLKISLAPFSIFLPIMKEQNPVVKPKRWYVILRPAGKLKYMIFHKIKFLITCHNHFSCLFGIATHLQDACESSN